MLDFFFLTVRGLKKNSIYHLPVQTLIFLGHSSLVFSASLFLSVIFKRSQSAILGKKKSGNQYSCIEF